MAKGKKKGKKKKKVSEEGANILLEVDKTFYELQITDLNRKLARLRSLTHDLEEKNIELEKNLQKLDEDRADVIAYLKRTLQEKQNELSELQERLLATQEAKDSDVKVFEEKIEEMTQEYNSMREQLISENKLITGKLNALEEFRMQRDALMQKFEEQEHAIEEQELRHKRVLYDTEKKFILGKDAIKREMEQQLFLLASDFEQANNLRIAATTQRVIRENIVINNEINRLLNSSERLESENRNLKEKNKELTINAELLTSERNKALSDSLIQKGVVKLLTKEHEKLKIILADNDIKLDQGVGAQRELTVLKKRERNLTAQVHILEQNLHATRCQEIGLQNDLKKSSNLCRKLQGTIYEAVMVIKAALLMQYTADVDESYNLSRRENLLHNLLSLMAPSKDDVMPISSIESVATVKEAYNRGDLGFIPKVHTQKRPEAPKFHMDSQVGHSLEDLFRPQVEVASLSSKDKEVISKSSESYLEEFEEEELSSSTGEEFEGERSTDDSTKKDKKFSKYEGMMSMQGEGEEYGELEIDEEI